MVHIQTGNMLDVVVEGKSIGFKQRDSDHRKYEVIWLPDPEALAMVLMAEIEGSRSALPQDKWQPIETAPKGELVLACMGDGWMGVMYGDVTDYHGSTPTHWMPLPATPVSTLEQTEE